MMKLQRLFQLLKDAGVDLVTIGQYLAPSPKHLAVDRFPELREVRRMEQAN